VLTYKYKVEAQTYARTDLILKALIFRAEYTSRILLGPKHFQQMSLALAISGFGLLCQPARRLACSHVRRVPLQMCTNALRMVARVGECPMHAAIMPLATYIACPVACRWAQSDFSEMRMPWRMSAHLVYSRSCSHVCAHCAMRVAMRTGCTSCF
jgi:hypothetical protein